MEDDPIYVEAVDHPPREDDDDEADGSPARSTTPRRLSPVWLAGVGVLLVIVALLIVPRLVTHQILTTPTLTMPLSPLPETPVVSLTPDWSLQLATVETLNAWRAANGYPALTINPLLTEIANRHKSFLSSLSLSEFDALDNPYRDAEGRSPQEAAQAAGYNGTVQMVVEVTAEDVTLDKLIFKLQTEGDENVHTRFSEVGLASERSLNTNLLYFVLILGSGNPS
jgi:uncharacterized protein YkwD